MKRTLSFLITLLFCRIAAAITLNGVDYTIDTLAQYPTGPGATYYQLRMLRASDRSGRLDCYLLAVDTHNPYVGVEQILGKDQLVGTERPSAMATRKSSATHLYYAGVNGDFFVTQGDVGRPTGLTVVNNEFAYTPTANRRLGGVDEQLRAVIGTKMSYSGKLVLPDTAYTIKHVNYTRAADELVLYNQHNGSTTGTNMYGTELLIRLLPDNQWHTSGTMMAEVLDKQVGIGSMAIPKGEAVLSGHGTMQQVLNDFAVGDTVTLRFSLKVDGNKVNMAQCIGGDTYALIVNNGQVEQSDFWNELHPRTAFGCSEDKSILYFLVVDGRGASVGCTTKVLGEIIHYYGAYTAVNWDGGGSSCMFVSPFGPLNDGSDGVERAVGNAMFTVANVPDDDRAIVSIAPYQPICKLPRYGIAEPKFLGYNRYGVLIDTCVQGVQLSCNASLGEILPDGRFLASGTQDGLLHASLPVDGASPVTCDLAIRLLTGAPVAFRLDSVLVDAAHPYTVQTQCTSAGHTYDLLPAALTWTSEDESVAVVDDTGLISAVGEGYTRVLGAVDDFIDSITVHIVPRVRGHLCWNDMTDPEAWVLSASDNFNPAWENTDVSFNYAGGRGPFLRIDHTVPIMAIPDTIRIPVRTDAVLKKLTVGIRPNNDKQERDIVCFENGFPLNEDANIDVLVTQVFGADMAVYPLHFEYLWFLFDQATTKQQHTIALQGVWLFGEPQEEDDLPSVSAGNNQGVSKIITPDGVRIIKDGKSYTLLGL